MDTHYHSTNAPRILPRHTARTAAGRHRQSLADSSRIDDVSCRSAVAVSVRVMVPKPRPRPQHHPHPAGGRTKLALFRSFGPRHPHWLCSTRQPSRNLALFHRTSPRPALLFNPHSAVRKPTGPRPTGWLCFADSLLGTSNLTPETPPDWLCSTEARHGLPSRAQRDNFPPVGLRSRRRCAARNGISHL